MRRRKNILQWAYFLSSRQIHRPFLDTHHCGQPLEQPGVLGNSWTKPVHVQVSRGRWRPVAELVEIFTAAEPSGTIAQRLPCFWPHRSLVINIFGGAVAGATNCCLSSHCLRLPCIWTVEYQQILHQPILYQSDCTEISSWLRLIQILRVKQQLQRVNTEPVSK